jgi:hypothetical protein
LEDDNSGLAGHLPRHHVPSLADWAANRELAFAAAHASGYGGTGAFNGLSLTPVIQRLLAPWLRPRDRAVSS